MLLLIIKKSIQNYIVDFFSNLLIYLFDQMVICYFVISVEYAIKQVSPLLCSPAIHR